MIVVNANKNIDIIKNILPIEPKWYVSECDISFIPSFSLISLYGEDSTIIEVQVHINIVIIYTPSIWSSPSCFGVLLLEEEEVIPAVPTDVSLANIFLFIPVIITNNKPPFIELLSWKA